VFKPQNKYDDKMLRDICVLAMLHDIGAYKTEEIDKMAEFEERNVWGHSAYGYLFLRYFSPLKNLAPAILFHHAACDEIPRVNPFLRELAQTIFLCDRADIFALGVKSTDAFKKYLEETRDILFGSDVIDKFLAADIELAEFDKSIDSDEDFNRLLYTTPISDEEVGRYLEMIIFSIDFRSHQTVVNTIATAGTAVFLGKLRGLNEEEREILRTGAMLHDIGKVGIPVDILENQKHLDEAKRAIMKTHVALTEKIIEGNVDEEIKNIAIRHHERMNGTGYPKNLKAEELSPYDRILAIADIFSDLCSEHIYKNAQNKEEIIRALSEMAKEGLIDPEIAALSIAHVGELLSEVHRVATPIVEAYTAMINKEYEQILGCINRADFKTISLS